MTEEKKQNNTTPAHPNYGGGAKEWIVSTIAGVVSGAVAAGHTVRELFLDEVKKRAGLADWTMPKAEADKFLEKYKDFKTLEEIKNAEGKVTHVKLEGLVNGHARELMDANVKHLGTPTNWRENATEIRNIKSGWAKKVFSFIEKEYGEIVGGWRGLLKGTFQQFPISLGNNSRNKVLYTGLTAATVVGVGSYNLLTSIATRKKAREIEDLILDKVLETPPPQTPAAQLHDAHAPSTQVTHVTNDNRLEAANGQAVSVRA